MAQPVMLDLEIDQELAWSLAQFLKRCGWSEIRGCSENDDEAYEVRDALAILREALQRKGIAPR